MRAAANNATNSVLSDCFEGAIVRDVFGDVDRKHGPLMTFFDAPPHSSQRGRSRVADIGKQLEHVVTPERPDSRRVDEVSSCAEKLESAPDHLLFRHIPRVKRDNRPLALHAHTGNTGYGVLQADGHGSHVIAICVNPLVTSPFEPRAHNLQSMQTDVDGSGIERNSGPQIIEWPSADDRHDNIR
jgi:hypothetical protein